MSDRQATHRGGPAALITLLALGTLGTAPVPAQSARSSGARGPSFEVHEASIADLQAAMTAGRTSAVALVDAYLARIAAYDAKGPQINSMRRRLAPASGSAIETTSRVMARTFTIAG